jgi:hypothetical protein
MASPNPPAHAGSLTPGLRLRSQTCGTEIIIIRPPAGSLALHCGGQPMVALDAGQEPSAQPEPGLDTGTQLGKRYTSPDGALEVLVTRSGAGTLSIGSQPLTIKEPKALPASD